VIRRLLPPAVVAGVALVLVLLQPFASPWWITADPDGAYVGSALNVLEGHPTVYLDHPGVPNQEALAVVFGAQYVVQRIAGHTSGVRAFVAHQLLHLDGARPVYRGFTIALFVAASLAAYAAGARWFRDRRWGVLTGIAFACTPALAPIGFMTKPDTAGAALALVVAVLIAAAFERRSASLYLAAGALLGFALTVKLVAVGLVPALVVSLLWRPPARGWVGPTARAAVTAVRRRRTLVASLAVAWVALAAGFGIGRTGTAPGSSHLRLLIGVLALVGVYAACAAAAARRGPRIARRLFDPFYLATAASLLAGIVLAAPLLLAQLPQVLLSIFETSTGSGLNASIEPFQYFALSSLGTYPLVVDALAVGLAVLAAAAGARVGVFWPAPLALAAVALFVEAAARLSIGYYYAPAFAVSIPGVLWLVRNVGRRYGLALGSSTVAALLVLAVIHRAPSPQSDVDLSGNAWRLAAQLPPGVIAVPAATYLPIDDVQYDELVVQYTYAAPDVQYRFVQAESPRIAENGLRLSYYTAPVAEIAAAARAGWLELSGRRYRVRRLPFTWRARGTYGVLQLTPAG
jgi:hypothetical protein